MKSAARLLLAVAVVASLIVAAGAADKAAKDAVAAKVETVVSGLDNPCGITVHKPSGQLFVSDSAAHQIVRVDAASGESSPVITGFPEDIYGKGPKYAIGPLGLEFLDDETLVVGGGGLVDGQELVQIYTIPEAGKTITAEDTKYTLGPIGPGEESIKGEGNFYGVTIGKHGIYISSNGDDDDGWVVRIGLTDGTPGELKPFIRTKVATNVDAPVGITMNRAGRLVVGQMGEVNIPSDSLLTLYDAESGKLLASAPTGLHDIAGLAYSPKSGKLYAVDFAWVKTEEGGLFRLDTSDKSGKMTVKAVKIAPLDKPTALAFAEDGSLYVTVFGTAKEGSDKKPGQVVRIDAEL